MHPEFSLQIGGPPWWQVYLIPIATTFLGAGAGAYFAMRASNHLRKNEVEDKNCSAAQWVLVCLFDQWYYLVRLRELFTGLIELYADNNQQFRFLYLEKQNNITYTLQDMRLQELSHFAFHGTPGLLIEMAKCQKLVQEVGFSIYEKDTAKWNFDQCFKVDYILNLISANAQLNDDMIGKIDELRKTTFAMLDLINIGIKKHIEVIHLFRKDLLQLHKRKFLGFTKDQIDQINLEQNSPTLVELLTAPSPKK